MSFEDDVGEVEAPRAPRARLLAALETLGADEAEVLALVAERLAMGRRLYGELRPATDTRDFGREALEEAADGLVYVAAALVRAGMLRGEQLGADGTHRGRRERCMSRSESRDLLAKPVAPNRDGFAELDSRLREERGRDADQVRALLRYPKHIGRSLTREAPQGASANPLWCRKLNPLPRRKPKLTPALGLDVLHYRRVPVGAETTSVVDPVDSGPMGDAPHTSELDTGHERLVLHDRVGKPGDDAVLILSGAGVGACRDEAWVEGHIQKSAIDARTQQRKRNVHALRSSDSACKRVFIRWFAVGVTERVRPLLDLVDAVKCREQYHAAAGTAERQCRGDPGRMRDGRALEKIHQRACHPGVGGFSVCSDESVRVSGGIAIWGGTLRHGFGRAVFSPNLPEARANA